MHHRVARCLCLVLALLAAPLARAATPQQVEQAMQKGIKWLYEKQKEGNWEEVPAPAPDGKEWETKGKQWGGLTAIATYALLASGESPDNPKLVEPIRFLKRSEIVGTYALGMRCQVWHYLPDNSETKALMIRDARLLSGAVKTKDQADGFFNYYNDRKAGGRYDHSCSNYGVLGLWTCANNGVLQQRRLWEQFEESWRRHQTQEGAWSYIFSQNTGGEGNPTMSMTSAGVATLFITQDYVHSMDGVNCTGNVTDAHIARGMKWMAENFEKFKENRPFYTLYNIERVGKASGYKYIGAINWYDVGVDYILRSQGQDGAWWNSVAESSFALLFLARGRSPVLMNKLDYARDDGSGRWNQRPRDAANATRWVGHQIERELNWQIVNLKAPVEELQDSPILYIAGSEALAFTDEEKQKLRTFVEQGGLIIGNADCGKDAFAQSFQKLSADLFPLYEMRELPEKHPIYTEEQFKRTDWAKPPQVLAVGNGAREFVILFPKDDPARAWQTRGLAGTRDALAEVLADVFLYAVDKKNLRFKGESHLVKLDEKVKPKRQFKVARLQYEGNWDPEPGGWRRLTALMHNLHAVTLQVEAVKLGDGKLSAGGYKAAHLTGTGALKLNEKALAEIKAFVDGGGTLIIDSCGGAGEFSLVASDAVQKLYAPRSAELVKPEHAVYRVVEPALAQVDYRSYAVRGLGNLKLPRLRGIDVGDRTAIFISHEDLSVGLVGHPVDGINGYEPASASALMARMLLYAAGDRPANQVAAVTPAPTTKPATQPGSTVFVDKPNSFASQLAKQAPGWTLFNVEGEFTEANGRSDVLVTRAKSAEPAGVRIAAAIPRNKITRLAVVAGHNGPAEAWDLVLIIDGVEMITKPVDMAHSKNGWTELALDLSGRAGTTLNIELQQRPRDNKPVPAYWAGLAVQSR